MHDSDHTQMFRERECERERQTVLLGKSAVIRGSQPRIKFLVHVFACMWALAATTTLPWPLLLASKRIMGQLTVCQESDWRSALKKKTEKLDRNRPRLDDVYEQNPYYLSNSSKRHQRLSGREGRAFKTLFQKLAVKLWLLLLLNVFINDFTLVKAFQKI